MPMFRRILSLAVPTPLKAGGREYCGITAVESAPFRAEEGAAGSTDAVGHPFRGARAFTVAVAAGWTGGGARVVLAAPVLMAVNLAHVVATHLVPAPDVPEPG